MSQDRPIILLINNEKIDTEIMSQSFKDAYQNSTIYHIENIKDLVNFLLKSNDYKTVKTPELIIYNTNNFDESAYKILDEIKCKSEFRFIPIVMILDKDSPNDVYKSYDKYINACIIKPDNKVEFQKILNSVADFWMNIVKLPFNS